MWRLIFLKNDMNFIFRLVLTINATSLLVIIFLIQKKHTLSKIFPEQICLLKAPDYVSYAIYLLLPVAMTWISIFFARYLSKDSFEEGQVISVEHANNSFLPSYLGYFFVALSIGDFDTLYFVYGILFVFTFLSQALYFNPLFLLFGYEFYNIKTKNGSAIFLISKEKYKKPDEVVTGRAARINNYTFINLE